MIKKIKNIFKNNTIDIQKLEYLTDELNYGEEGAKLLNDGRTKKKKNKAATQLTIQILKRENRKKIIRQFGSNLKSRYLIYGMWSLLVIAIIFLIPITYNKVFNIPSKHVAGETSDWISFYGSYLGGLFGGLLTLIGVRLTISHNNKNYFIENFPKKDIVLRDIIIEIEKLIEKINECRDKDKLFSYLLEFNSKELELKEKAINVNPTTYKTLDKLFEFVTDQNRIQLLFMLNQNKGVQNILTGYLTIFSKLKSKLFNEYEKNANK